MALLQGEVEVGLRGDDRRYQPVTRMMSPEIVGELALLTNEPRTADVKAVKPVNVMVLRVSDFEALAVESPIIRALLTELVSRRLGEFDFDGMCHKTVDDYVIERPLGRGGMSVVYEARKRETGRSYALKMMNHCLIHDPQAFSRFKRERNIIRSLRHENVVRVESFFEAYRTYFHVMELCDGADLGRVVTLHGKLPEEQVRRILGQVARALAHAHGNGIVHRDLKPANLMLNQDGTVKLMDFGLAKPVLADGFTGRGVVLGTPAYMPPEQRAGHAVDERADYYSFGVTAYELLHGRFNSVDCTTHEVLTAESGRELRYDHVRPGVSRELREILKTCLAEDRKYRDLKLERIGDWAGVVDTALLRES